MVGIATNIHQAGSTSYVC